MKALVFLILPLAACGRAGFDERAPIDAAPDAPPPVLACDATPRFAVAKTTSLLAATSTSAGYFVLAVDGAGAVTGSAYQFSLDDPGRPLAQSTAPLAIMTNATGSAAGLADGDNVLLEVPYGRPAPTGTALVPLTAQLAARGAPIRRDGWIGGPSMIARGAAGGSVVLGQDLKTQDIEAQRVASDGTAIGSPLPLVPGSTNPQSPTITVAGTLAGTLASTPAAGDRFLVTWNAPGANDAEVRAQVFDSQLVPKTGVTKISFDPVNGSELPRAAYAPGADRYLFAWYQKTNSGDEVWLSLRDGNLAEIGPVSPLKLATQGVLPVIAAGDDSFLVVWQTAGKTLSASRIRGDGTVTALGVPNTGGTSAGWDVVVHDGQPALVWIEAGGTGPNLWLNPLCQ